jgi:soluble lytic murein transglycosylase-like protein
MRQAESRPPHARTEPGTRWSCLGILTVVFGLATPTLASADIVRFTSGRTMSVDTCKIEGDTATIVLRGGGEMKAPKSIIEEVLPDEYLHAAPEPLPAYIAPASAALSSTEVHELVDRLAARHGVDVRLAHALVQVESNYEARAVSPKGASGLMQIMPSVAHDYALADPFDPEQNLDVGLRHLRGLLDLFKSDVRLALAAYNAGLGAVTRYGGVPPYRETQNYVQRIMTLARR